MVILKKIAKKPIFVSILLASLLCINQKQIFATDEASNYTLEPMMLEGPIMSMVKKENVVNETLNLWNNTTNELEEYAISTDKISVEVSDPNLVSVENNIIKAKEEGEIVVKYKHTYNGMDFEYEGKYTIYDERFSNRHIPVLNNSYMNLKAGEDGKNIDIRMRLATTDIPLYPEGYNETNYYKYEWTLEDDSIAKIENVAVNDEEGSWFNRLVSSAKVIPLKEGNTKAFCKITTIDGNESITKTINITVTGDSTPTPAPSNPEVNPKQEPVSTGDKTVAKTILPAAGKSSIIIAIIVILSIVAVVFYNKRKID